MSYFHTTAALVMALSANAVSAETLWTTGGFDMPESALFDPVRDRIIVSVIGGHPGEADGNGTLALLSADGDLLDAAWTTGLNAPKGMALVGDTLLVADLTQLHEIDAATGELRRSLTAPGAVFLNDVSADGTAAFISDFMANTLWRYEGGRLALWLEDPQLSHPNGLLLDGDRLIVGSWGQGMQTDFSTQTPGSLLSVSLATQEITVLAEAVGNIDGVVRIGEALLVSDWNTGQLFEIAPGGNAVLVGEYAPGLADISAHGSTLFLPSMLEGTISARAYP